MAAELISLHLSQLNQLLTCSFCHGLLKQATCLYCNHHFCMACILDFFDRSAGSCCPTCKLPAIKRHAQYSPEVDKIVATYKSLEFAAVGLQQSISENPQQPTPNSEVAPEQSKSGKHIHKHKKKRKKIDEEECLGSPMKVERPHLADGVQVCASEQKTGIMSSYKGPHLRLSKRVQLPCPGASGTTEEIMPSLDATVSLTLKDALNAKGDLHQSLPVPARDLSSRPSEYNSSTVAKEQLCLPFEDKVIGNVVSIMVKSKEISSVPEGHGDGTDTQHLTSQNSNVNQKLSPVAPIHGRTEKDSFALDQLNCAFCQTSKDSLVAGPMIHYEKGVPVKAGRRIKSLLSVHQHCAEWAPNVYYVGDVCKNLLKEVARGQKLKCSCCGLKGAVLGCLVKRCVKTFHYPCARTLSCRWDDVNFLVLCPEHVSSSLPGDDKRVKPESRDIDLKAASAIPTELENDVVILNKDMQPFPKALQSQDSSTKVCKAEGANKQVTFAEPKKNAESSSTKWSHGGAARNWVLCGSSLNDKAYEILASLVSQCGAKLTKTWDPCVTHLIIGTDKTGAANRTLKFLLASLAGTWILRSEWLNACISACQPVSEELYEVNADIHGMVGGPKRSRLRAASRTQGLFEALEFHLIGDYAAPYKGDLQALIKAAGGRTVSPPEEGDAGVQVQSCKIVVYNAVVQPHAANDGDCQEANRRRWREARSLACRLRAHVVGHTWILDCIAAGELWPFN